MNTGFYKEYCKIHHFDFEFMINDKRFELDVWDEKKKRFKKEIFDSYHYLHGKCCDFALLLNHMFGYKIIVVTSDYIDDDGNTYLNHCWCVNRWGHKIDVRGKTKDDKLFLSEFCFGDGRKHEFDNAKDAYDWLRKFLGDRYEVEEPEVLKSLSKHKLFKKYYG